MEELLLIYRKLPLEDVQGWFGAMPSEAAKAALGFEELKIVLETVANGPVSPPESVVPVPSGKLRANALSTSVEVLLTAGMTKTYVVREFFKVWHDQLYGEKVANSIREKYQALKGKMLPDQIYSELETWAGGGDTTPRIKVAVLAVLAYFFERCDIFEKPRESGQ